jgi:hypothetical protein
VVAIRNVVVTTIAIISEVVTQTTGRFIGHSSSRKLHHGDIVYGAMHHCIAMWDYEFCGRQSGIADTPRIEITVSVRMTQRHRQPTASDAATA